MISSSDQPVIRVFVHLAYDKDAQSWRNAWLDGHLVGLNDETPYGYGRANDMGCEVAFSKSHQEGPIIKFARLVLRFLLGFDLLHAWRQRRSLSEVDVVWTHTESQFLAISMIMLLFNLKFKIIGQAVWLFDVWDTLPRVKKLLYRSLIKKIDVLTVHSPDNLAKAKSLLPHSDIRLVPYGIPSEVKHLPTLRRSEPLRVLAIGNDRHRDWTTLINAVRDQPWIYVRILSGTVSKGLVRGVENVSARLATTNEELKGELSIADVVCIPLKRNLHASGITAIQEAVLSGVPVVATATGGLEYYFSSDEISYITCGDPYNLRDALNEFRREPEKAMEMATKAQNKMSGKNSFGAARYIRRHVEISQELLGIIVGAEPKRFE